MLENRTFDEILASMKEAVGGALSTIEGSFVDSVLRACALELAQDYFDQNALLPIAFVDETSGEYLDLRAAEYGLVRKSGTLAAATVTFAGADGVRVPAGTVVVTADGLAFATDEDAVISDGCADVGVTAEAAGAAYNVAEGAIVSLQAGGSVTVAASTAAAGGTDDESDSALLARLLALWQTPATSGNAYAYEQWALECEGIGGAKVLPLWDGPGTVKVLLADAEMLPPTVEQVESVAAYIESQRPIGAAVTVEAAGSVEICVAAEVVAGASADTGAAETEFRAALAEYFAGLALTGEPVRYAKIAYLLLDTAGVVDQAGLTVNGGTENIPLDGFEVPILGEVTLTWS